MSRSTPRADDLFRLLSKIDGALSILVEGQVRRSHDGSSIAWPSDTVKVRDALFYSREEIRETLLRVARRHKVKV